MINLGQRVRLGVPDPACLAQTIHRINALEAQELGRQILHNESISLIMRHQ